MIETPRFEATPLVNGADILFQGSDLPSTADLSEDWLKAARDAIHAATPVEKPITIEQELSHEISGYGRIVLFRHEAANNASERLAA